MMKRLIPVFLMLILISAPVYADDYQEGWDAYKQKDYKTALEKFKSLAEQGHIKAQANLGAMYDKGEGGEIKLPMRVNLKLSRRFLSLPDKFRQRLHHHINPG